MFSSHRHLKRKTPCGGVDRREFIGHLVEEFYTTTNVEAQEQVSSNLANFAYDPINWKYLKQANTLQLFTAVLSVPNDKLQRYGLAGLCNICLDNEALVFITHKTNVALLFQLFLNTESNEILLNCIILFYQILSVTEDSALKHTIAAPIILKKIVHFTQNSENPTLINLASLFLEDYGRRIDVHKVQSDNNDNESVRRCKALV